MASIIRGKSKCSICNNLLESDDNIIGTTAFISDSTNPLWRFSNSVMHQSCFLTWEHKQNFIKKYNETIGTIVWGNGRSHHMEEDGTISSVIKKG